MKLFYSLLLIACFVSAAAAVDRSAHSTARPGLVGGGTVPVHRFVNVKEIASTKEMIFISDAANNVVNIYNTSGKQLAQLTGFSEPQGLATDAKGNLYVADTANSRVQIYAPPYNKTPKTLDDSGQYPAGVAVFNNGEYVAVTNIISTSGGAGSITIYKNGKQGQTITNGDFARVYFDAFDSTGCLFVDGSNSNGGVEVGLVPHLTSGGTSWKTLSYSNTIFFPGGVQVTNGDKIVIDDQDAASLYTYDQPKSGNLGNPVATTAIDGSSDAVTFAFTQNNADLWTADAGNEDSAEYAYPAGGSAKTTISVTGGEPIGAAVVPAQVP